MEINREVNQTIKQKVINIIPPRELWKQLNWTRSLYFDTLRCGPHITLINPLRLPDEELSSSAHAFQQACLALEHFTVTLDKFCIFRHLRRPLVYLEPKFNPPHAFEELIEVVIKIFPQHTEQLQKIIAHLSIAQFKAQEPAEKCIAVLEKDWIPVSFEVRELYILTRVNIDPFDVANVIHLGRENKNLPAFGLNSASPESAVARTLTLVNFPSSRINNKEELETLANAVGLLPTKMELILQPNLKPRPLAIFEFKTKEAAEEALRVCQFKTYLDFTIWLKPLECITYPDIVGGSSCRENYNLILT